VGLDFMKIDVFFVKDVHKDSVNQNLLKTLATLAHSIGIDAIAEGVASEDELLMVDKLGLDGASGPIVTQQFEEKKTSARGAFTWRRLKRGQANSIRNLACACERCVRRAVISARLMDCRKAKRTARPNLLGRDWPRFRLIQCSANTPPS